MGKYKAIIPIIFALVIAGSGSLFLHKWLSLKSEPKEVIAAETKTIPVVVAALDLAWGIKLDKEMTKTLPYLKESLPTAYHSVPEEISGRILIAQLKANEPITEYRLAPDSIKTGGVSAVVTPGKRALAVKGDKVIGISGFINPGNRVDVLVTLKHPKTKTEMTKLVLENILVLATGTEVQENEKGEPAPVDVYTLEVSPEEGEKLALASAKGKLQFALRNVIDNENVLTKGATIPQTLSSLKKTVPVKGRNATPKNSPLTVEVIKGDQITKKKF